MHNLWVKGRANQTDHLVRMLNQIAANLAHPDDPGKTATAIETHLRKFWARPMKAAIVAHLEKGGTGLTAPARRAVEGLSRSRESVEQRQ